MRENQVPRKILPLIVFSQFCCTSLWFAGNAVMPQMTEAFHLPGSALPHLTSAVQFGFITGTLLFALLTISDRYSPSSVFFLCALAGAAANAFGILESNTFLSLLLFRFCTGFFLAGIYPVGMKIASDYFDRGLGKSLGYLVGALVLGTAFPHLLNEWTGTLPWKTVLIITSLLAVTGGVILFAFIPDGPRRVPGTRPDLSAFFRVFRKKEFRSVAFGYFGHMWELYTFWAFVPVMLTGYLTKNPEQQLQVSFWSFLIIGIGSLACVAGGYLAQSLGTRKTAATALFMSGCCCLLSPVMLHVGSLFIFLTYMLFWGMTVIADSPLFSTMVAQNAPSGIKGTALTIVNCVGFSLTILSIQVISLILTYSAELGFVMLALGPLFGLISLGYKRIVPAFSRH